MLELYNEAKMQHTFISHQCHGDIRNNVWKMEWWKSEKAPDSVVWKRIGDCNTNTSIMRTKSSIVSMNWRVSSEVHY